MHLGRVDPHLSLGLLPFVAISESDDFAFILERKYGSAFAIVVPIVVENFVKGRRIFLDTDVHLDHKHVGHRSGNILIEDQLLLENCKRLRACERARARACVRERKRWEGRR